jgi:MFS family permease
MKQSFAVCGVGSNVRLYYWFKLFFEPILWGPILITYMGVVAGMKLTEIYLMEAICMILVTTLQIPTGAIADKFGRANSIRIGMVFIMGEAICFALGSSKTMMYVSNSLWAIGFSFISGADSALLFDSLKDLGRESEFKKIAGRSQGIRLGIVSIASIFAGHLAKINIRLPITIDACVIGIGLVISMFFVEPSNISQKKASYGDHMWQSILFVFKRTSLIWIISFSVLVGVTSKLWFFTYNPYFSMVGLPLPYYGYVFAVLNLVASLSSYNADKISRKLSQTASVRSILSLIVVPILLMGLIVSRWSVPLVFLQNLVRGYLNPFLEHLMHDHIHSKNRATVMSVKSTCHGTVEIIAMMMFSVVTAAYALNYSLIVLGSASCIVGTVLIWTHTKIFPKKDA